MTIYSLYIFDRHCDCVYYQDWHRTRPLRPPAPSNFRPNVHRLAASSTTASSGAGTTGGDVRDSIFSDKRASGSTLASAAGVNGLGVAAGLGTGAGTGAGSAAAGKGLPFDEEAKLVYGVILSLRNMVKKLSGKDEAFTSYKTPGYKLHLYETLTGFKFVLLSDAQTDSLRFVLRQIHVGPFVEYVVRNPLVEMDSRTSGIDNDQFRGAVDKHIRSLSVFGPS